DRAAVADLDVADLLRRFGEEGAGLANQCRGGDLCVRRRRPDRESLALLLDARKSLDPADVDERLGIGEAKLHRREQAVSAGEHPGALTLQELRGLSQRLRAEVLEVRGIHVLPPRILYCPPNPLGS